jgi:putative intracellular protease/amidase
MYREMLEDAAFRKPLAWDRAALLSAHRMLPKRSKRRKSSRRSKRHGSSRSVGGSPDSGDGIGGSSSGGESDAIATPDQLLVPESFDGMVLVGLHPAAMPSSQRAWDDPALQSVVAAYWTGGGPIAAFSNAVLVLARARLRPGSGASNGVTDGAAPAESHNNIHHQPLIAAAMTTCVPWYAEYAAALYAGLFSCRWAHMQALLRPSASATARSVAPGSSRYVTVQQEVTAALANPVNFVAGDSPLRPGNLLLSLVQSELPILRLPSAYDDERTVVVEDGAYINAQGGGDAFLLTRRFLAKLEEVHRVF